MDKYLNGMMDRPIGSVDVVRRYTEHEERERERLLGLIEAEKIEYYRRCEPYLKALERIEANAVPVIVIRSAPR